MLPKLPCTVTAQEPSLTLIHGDGRDILGCWGHTNHLAARHLPLHLAQVPEDAADAGAQVWSIAHPQAELRQGQQGAKQSCEQGELPKSPPDPQSWL